MGRQQIGNFSCHAATSRNDPYGPRAVGLFYIPGRAASHSHLYFMRTDEPKGIGSDDKTSDLPGILDDLDHIPSRNPLRDDHN